MPDALAKPDARRDCLAALQAEVDAIEGVFAEAVEALIAGREGLVAMIGALRAYEKGLQSCIDLELPKVISRLAERLADAETRDTESLQKSKRMISALAGMTEPLHRLQVLIRTLEIFSSTASVVETEAELAGGSTYSSQIKSLSLKSVSGFRDLKELVGGLRDRVETLRTTQEEHASAGLQRLAGVGDRLRELSRGVDADLGKAKAPARRLYDVAGQVEDRMTRTLAALQVGDSFRQRLEHVIEALRAVEGTSPRDPSARSLIRIIGARQLLAAADALGRDLATLPGNLRAIRTDTQTLLTMGQGLKADQTLSARFLPIKDLSARSLAALYSGQAQRQKMEDQISAMRAVVRDVEVALDRQADLDEEMKLGSVNVALRSRSAVRGGKAMNYVAREIAELIVQCLKQRREVIARLPEIVTSISDAQDQQALSADLKAISDDLGGLNDVLRVWETLAGGIEALLQTGPASAAAFGDCADRMEAQHALADRVREIAGELGCDSAGVEPQDLYRDVRAAEAADWMRSLYSVPEERDLHDAICGTRADQSVGTAASLGDTETEGDAEFEWF